MMKYKIEHTTKEKWLNVAKTCSYATFFHTPCWYDIIVPDQQYTILDVIFDDGKSAIVPVAKVKRMGGLIVDNFSSPGGNYGGWISADVLSESHIKILTDVMMSMKNLTYRINPFFASSSLTSSSLTSSTTTPPLTSASSLITSSTPTSTSIQKKLTDDHTHIIDLTRGIDEIYSAFSKGHKSAISFAQRNDVTIKPAASREEWDQYYNIYTDSVKRWRANDLTPRVIYPQNLFRRAYDMRGNRVGRTDNTDHTDNTDNIILWLAIKDDKPISGALYFYFNKHAVYWHGAAAASYLDCKPNNLLHYEIIKDAARRGYEFFDFNPSGGYDGVETFKERFGAVKINAPILTTRTLSRQFLSRILKRR